MSAMFSTRSSGAALYARVSTRDTRQDTANQLDWWHDTAHAGQRTCGGRGLGTRPSYGHCRARLTADAGALQPRQKWKRNVLP
jgi:hypothetical protein